MNNQREELKAQLQAETRSNRALNVKIIDLLELEQTDAVKRQIAKLEGLLKISTAEVEALQYERDYGHINNQ